MNRPTKEFSAPHKFSIVLLAALACLCLLPAVTSAAALVLGILFALFFKHPFPAHTKSATKKLLSLAVIGLGAGMNLEMVADVGTAGITYTFIGIACTLALGGGLARLLRSDAETSLLISVGTAICGGSAIAAVAPVIRAKEHSISIALGVVFLLNSLALILFPWIGHHFGLTQTQFGLWAALAIHDTSSVVGATLQYGSDALRIGTTVKLSRALWIVIITPIFALWMSRKRKKDEPQSKTQKPWFILGFILLAALFTYVPVVAEYAPFIEKIAKKTLTLCLFFIGTHLSVKSIKEAGIRPILLGSLLWLVVSTVTLFAIEEHWIGL